MKLWLGNMTLASYVYPTNQGQSRSGHEASCISEPRHQPAFTLCPQGLLPGMAMEVFYMSLLHVPSQWARSHS